MTVYSSVTHKWLLYPTASLRIRVCNGRVVERVKEPEIVEDQTEHAFWI